MTLAPTAPLKVAWINDFPVEWLPDIPEQVKHLPRMHPRSWQQVLLREFENRPMLQLHILVLRKHLEQDVTFEQNGVHFHLLRVPRGLRELSLYWADTLILRRALNRIRPDILHVWGTERGEGLVAQRLGYPYLVTIQGLLMWYSEQIPLNRHERFAAFWEKKSLPGAPLVTTESRFAVNYLQKRFPRLRILQVEHAPHPRFFQIERKPQLNPFRFLFVGHLDHRKGADLLLSALECIRDEMDFEFIVAGGVSERFSPLLQTLRSQQAWKGVQLYKNLSPSEVGAELSRATILLFPTRADTSPNAVKEAVVAGVPVVASAIGGITDYVVPGRNGLTFEAGNNRQFIEALREACRDPLFKCGKVAPGTLAKTRDYLSPVRMGERFWLAYEIVSGRMGYAASPFCEALGPTTE